MKISGRNIKRRLHDWSYRPSDIKRMRYWRGHGVHSPFVYNIVRQVFMCRKLNNCENNALYDALVEHDIPRKRCIQLQNLLHHCQFSTYAINCSAEALKDIDLAIITTDIDAAILPSLAAAATKSNTTLCIMAPAFGKQRRQVCCELAENHRCTSIDNRGYLLLFNNHLPKQVFRL